MQAELAARRQDGAVLERLGGLEQHASSLVGRGVPRPVRALLEEAFAVPPHMRPFVVSKHRAVIGEQFRDFTDADWTRAVAACLPQHRGRLFLPFADDDPRTAEVLSKVLLLARDREIRDPSILEWIRAARSGA